MPGVTAAAVCPGEPVCAAAEAAVGLPRPVIETAAAPRPKPMVLPKVRLLIVMWNLP
jgi:hypothetical protein